MPHPLILEPPPERNEPWASEDDLSFGVTLVGTAVDLFPYVVAAVDRMAREGLGVARIPFKLQSVSTVAPPHHLLWPGETGAIEPLPATQMPADDGRPSSATIRFITPTRLTENGRISSEFRFRLLARAAVARLSSLLHFHCGTTLDLDFPGVLRRAETVEVTEAQLSVRKLTRWSNRQQSKLWLDGLVGSATLRGDNLAEWWPLLRAGEIVHVGKGAVMGLGRYELRPTN